MTHTQRTTIKGKLTLARQQFLDLVFEFGECEWQYAVYGEDQVWTVVDILRHLTSAEVSMTRLIQSIRDGGEGVSTDFDLQRWNARGIKKAGAKLPHELLEEMSRNRTILFKVIDELQEEDFAKSGRHGSLRIMTIEEILNRIADHELEHTQDVGEAVKKSGGV